MKRIDRVENRIWELTIIASAFLAAGVVTTKIVVPLHGPRLYETILLALKLVFVLDIAWNYFFLPRVKKRSDETLTVEEYFRFWVFFDLAAAAPYELLSGEDSWELLTLLKLVSVARLMSGIVRRDAKFSGYWRLFFFLMWFALFAHFTSLGWIMIRGLDYTRPTIVNYVNSLYWSVAASTDSLFGEFDRLPVGEKLYSIFVKLAGIGLFGYLIANFVSMIRRRDPVHSGYLENVEKLASNLHYRNLSPELREKILDYYAYLRKTRRGYDEKGFLKTLPKSLRKQVSAELKKDFLVKIPVFAEAGDEFLEEIALRLEPEIATPGDMLFKAGDEAESGYFVVAGALVALDEEENVLADIEPGNYFGEIALFSDATRTASIRAVDYCDLYRLRKRDFLDTCKKFPSVAKRIKPTADK